MPIYEFACTACDRSFEELLRSAEAVSTVKCPTCGSLHVRRKISMFAAKAPAGGGGLSFANNSAASCAPSGG